MVPIVPAGPNAGGRRSASPVSKHARVAAGLPPARPSVTPSPLPWRRISVSARSKVRSPSPQQPGGIHSAPPVSLANARPVVRSPTPTPQANGLPGYPSSSSAAATPTPGAAADPSAPTLPLTRQDGRHSKEPITPRSQARWSVIRNAPRIQKQESERISTGVRVRPLLVSEHKANSSTCLTVEGDSITVIDPHKRTMHTFECDFVFDSSDPSLPSYCDQEAVYRRVGKPLVDHALQGYNCCLCAYGQTGTGKTHTTIGDWSSKEQRGLLPRFAEGLLDSVDDICADGGEVRLHASYIEIYNDRCRDLLLPTDIRPGAPPGKDRELVIHAHPQVGVWVENLIEVPVCSFHEVGELVAQGEKSRHTASTSMNKSSSRSHCVFTFRIEVTRGSQHEGKRMSVVRVVDLAGRENEHQTEATGERLRELTHINRGLFQLANCIYALSSSDGRGDHVPFRNSKLTMLLSESFLRNSRTCVLATLTPSVIGLEDNLLTCRFLESARRIMTQPVANRFCADDLVAPLQDEIAQIQEQLRNGDGAHSPDAVQRLMRLNSKKVLLHNIADADLDNVDEADGSPRYAVQERQAREKARRHSNGGTDESSYSRAGEFLENASTILKRLDEENALIKAALGKAENRVSALERAARQLEMEASSNATAASRAGAVVLPPLAVAQTAPKEPRAAPIVTFSVQLPPIVVLE
eukprot:gnl/TRDRNA2_/TRDRNA2_45094_c0_seq1.p1 gnl/TRDRNA2_/TRDRNA2_45094_c0~~gnl/TRDRNA2_/TRDRNA2_45094_c0_seq1.p1  ORF type:complete len:696 (-),score=76.60 gnl/TRDRNA2_/TRDRNA2_45094_c0_seq1:87-2174(-)